MFERAAELRELGAGIGLGANAIRVLEHLGLMQRVIERGTVIKEAASYNWRGQLLVRVPMADVPSVCLHRAELHAALLSALPQDCIHIGEEFLEFTAAETRSHLINN